MSNWLVLTRVGNGFENVWTMIREDGSVSLSFATQEEAEEELREHLADMDEAGMEYDRDDFVIREEPEGA